MASTINTVNIDINFPIAGQDNDTQTFRNNFSAIRNNFAAAATEISALQANSASSSTSPASSSSSGTAGQIAYGRSYYTPTVTDTYGNVNLIKVGTITNLEAGQAVTFSANLGGLVTGTTYYIKNVYSGGNITVSNARATSTSESITLSTASGNITANASSYYLYVCVSTNIWQRTPLSMW